MGEVLVAVKPDRAALRKATGDKDLTVDADGGRFIVRSDKLTDVELADVMATSRD